MQVIEANLNGEMELKIETDLVCITTHFRDLGNPPWGKHFTSLFFRPGQISQIFTNEIVQ